MLTLAMKMKLSRNSCQIVISNKKLFYISSCVYHKVLCYKFIILQRICTNACNHTFTEVDHEMISSAILFPSGCCQLQVLRWGFACLYAALVRCRGYTILTTEVPGPGK